MGFESYFDPLMGLEIGMKVTDHAVHVVLRRIFFM